MTSFNSQPLAYSRICGARKDHMPKLLASFATRVACTTVEQIRRFRKKVDDVSQEWSERCKELSARVLQLKDSL